jgi:hypothetical protein
MPPVMVYAVNFNNGNLHPIWNPNGWADMRMSTQVPGVTESWADGSGLGLRFIRTATPMAGAPADNSVYVMPPPGAVSLDTRFSMTVAFDLPLAEGLPDGGGATIPEPWAVALSVRGAGALGERAVHVTCQFNVKGELNGVRLNTPSALQNLSTTLPKVQAAPLDRPLDYSRYRRAEGEAEPPLFILEHAFCGIGAVQYGHAPGSGSLTLRSSREPEKRDHRVYSTAALSNGLAVTDNFIAAFGVSVVTLSGIGRVSARLRGFELSFNTAASLEPVPEPELGSGWPIPVRDP